MRGRRTKLIYTVVGLLLTGMVLGPNVWAFWHFRAAERALARRAFAAAERSGAQCLKVWIRGADTRLLAAREARMQGDCDRAERLLQASWRCGGDSAAISVEANLVRAQLGELPQVETSYLAWYNKATRTVAISSKC
jgi:hypothetical protein